MTAIGSRVVKLHSGVRDVGSMIEVFLNDKRINSERTAVSYEGDIRQFFRYMCRKELHELTVDDIKTGEGGILHSDILQYKNELVECYAASTVNHKMSVVRQVFGHLAKDFPTLIHLPIFDVETVKGESKPIGWLTWDEVEKMIELAKSLPSGEQKSLAIELAARTGIRLEALHKLTIDNFTQHEGYVLITVLDKGKKKDEKPIPYNVFEKVVQLTKRFDGKLFKICKRTLQRAVTDELVPLMGIEEEREISFHSIKKMGVMWVLEETGDLQKAAIHGNHSNIQTTWKYYVEKHKNHITFAALQMGRKVDLSPLEHLSREELLALIQNASRGTQIELLSKVGVLE